MPKLKNVHSEGIITSYLLPLVWIFLIPTFSLYFFSHTRNIKKGTMYFYKCIVPFFLSLSLLATAVYQVLKNKQDFDPKPLFGLNAHGV